MQRTRGRTSVDADGRVARTLADARPQADEGDVKDADGAAADGCVGSGRRERRGREPVAVVMSSPEVPESPSFSGRGRRLAP